MLALFLGFMESFVIFLKEKKDKYIYIFYLNFKLYIIINFKKIDGGNGPHQSLHGSVHASSLKAFISKTQ